MKKKKRLILKRITHTARRHKKKLKKILRLAALILLLGVFVFSLVKLIGIGASYLKNRKAYKTLRETSAYTEAAGPMPAFTPAPAEAEPTPTPEPLPYYPDWEQLKITCPDIVGWLYLEGTNIHYPVVQGENNTFYLDHNALGEENSGGALFLDTACGADCTNLIIYGHRMKDDSMFGRLPNYSEKRYLLLHPTMYYLTPEQNYRMEIFSCRTVKAEAKYFSMYFSSENEYRQYLEKAVEQSYWAPTFTPDPQYKMMTLSTCSTYTGISDPRLLVHGMLIPIQ